MSEAHLSRWIFQQFVRRECLTVHPSMAGREAPEYGLGGPGGYSPGAGSGRTSGASVDDLLLPAVHPSRNGYEEESPWCPGHKAGNCSGQRQAAEVCSDRVGASDGNVQGQAIASGEIHLLDSLLDLLGGDRSVLTARRDVDSVNVAVRALTGGREENYFINIAVRRVRAGRDVMGGTVGRPTHLLHV